MDGVDGVYDVDDAADVDDAETLEERPLGTEELSVEIKAVDVGEIEVEEVPAVSTAAPEAEVEPVEQDETVVEEPLPDVVDRQLGAFFDKGFAKPGSVWLLQSPDERPRDDEPEPAPESKSLLINDKEDENETPDEPIVAVTSVDEIVSEFLSTSVDAEPTNQDHPVGLDGWDDPIEFTEPDPQEETPAVDDRGVEGDAEPIVTVESVDEIVRELLAPTAPPELNDNPLRAEASEEEEPNMFAEVDFPSEADLDERPDMSASSAVVEESVVEEPVVDEAVVEDPEPVAAETAIEVEPFEEPAPERVAEAVAEFEAVSGAIEESTEIASSGEPQETAPSWRSRLSGLFSKPTPGNSRTPPSILMSDPAPVYEEPADGELEEAVEEPNVLGRLERILAQPPDTDAAEQSQEPADENR